MLFRSISICAILLFTGVNLSAQKYTIYSILEVMRTAGNPLYIDDTYEWTNASRSGLQQFGIGFEKNTWENISLGIAISYCNQKSILTYQPSSSINTIFNVYRSNYLGIRPSVKYVLPFKFKGVYWENGVSFYRLLSTQKQIEVNRMIVSKESYDSNALEKNVFNITTELGIKFPLLVRYKPIRIEGEVGVQLNAQINDFIKSDSNNFLQDGIHFGLNFVFN